MSHPERIDPDTTEPGILALHLKRYEFGLRFCAGAAVLDAACGAGYGTAHLRHEAERVVGVDRSDETIERARQRYSFPNVEFRVGDVEALADPGGTYDVVCSFETIEHVDDAERTLAEFARVLRDAGTLVVSTPNAAETTTAPANPFHHVEWSSADFAALLGRHFAVVELYGQRRRQTGAHRLAQRLDVLGLRRRLRFLRGGARLLGTAPTAELTLADVVIDRELDRASELIAVCRGPRR